MKKCFFITLKFRSIAYFTVLFLLKKECLIPAFFFFQGIRAVPLPATVVELKPSSAPKVTQEVRAKSDAAVPLSAFENGLATGNESSWYFKLRNRIHRKRKENIKFNLVSRQFMVILYPPLSIFKP